MSTADRRATDTPAGLPPEVAAWLGEPRHEELGEVAVEWGAVGNALAACENGNPLFWDEAVAAALTGGPVAPPTTLSTWFRPHHWAPGRAEPRLPLQVHFDLKDRLGLPEAVISDYTIAFHEPLRPGDRVRSRQVLRAVSDEKTTRLGTGRFWTIDVEVATTAGVLAGVETYTGFGYRRATETAGTAAATAGSATAGGDGGGAAAQGGAAGSAAAGGDGGGSAAAQGGAGGNGPVAPAAGGSATMPRRRHGDVAVGEVLPPIHHEVTATTVVLGALASRDWRPMHHDRDFAQVRNGTRDIFLNTPTQATWFERLVTDWTGPHGRLGRMRFQMRSSVFPGDTMTLSATVTGTSVDDAGCGWVQLDMALTVDGRVCTTGEASVALPVAADDNPWTRRGAAWAS